MNKEYNEITIKSYNEALDKYLNGTQNIVNGEFKEWIDKVLSYIGKNDKILEIGTGPGRDADYIDNLGYSLQRSDFSDSFIEYNKQNGKNIIKLNILEISIKEKYDLIFANAVLLHFKKQDFIEILKNFISILNKNGITAFSLKKGFGEEFVTTKVDGLRFFKYYQEDEIKDISKKLGFEILYSKSVDNDKWLHFILKKI